MPRVGASGDGDALALNSEVGTSVGGGVALASEGGSGHDGGNAERFHVDFI